MRFCFLLLVFTVSSSSWSQNYSADNLFEAFSQSIYQVRIIDIESGSQSSIGSGFVVVDGYSLATNYHVISSVVHDPVQYRAEIIRGDEAIELEVDSFDIVHDLALLTPKKKQYMGKPLLLSPDPISKGRLLFSIGNPHDIGMTVVEGTYNGLVEHQFIDLIHFSGSINPGMSGGPVINTKGAVVGVNVATSGDQIGFLVPVNALQNLLNNRVRFGTKNFEMLMQDQIAQFTTRVIDELLNKDWPLEPMGSAHVLGSLSSRMECWGSSHKDEDKQLDTITKGCSNNDSIYIEPGFTTGIIEYEFEYQQAYDWNTTTFYHYMTSNLAGVYPGNSASDENVDSYRCQINIVSDAKQNINKKLNYCVRPYLEIEGLFDVFYLASSIDQEDKMLIEHYTLAGVTESAANRFLSRFVGEAALWQ